eukprot:UN03710
MEQFKFTKPIVAYGGKFDVTDVNIMEGPVLISFFFGSQFCARGFSDFVELGITNPDLKIIQFTPIDAAHIKPAVESINNQLVKSKAPVEKYHPAFVCLEDDADQEVLSDIIRAFKFTPARAGCNILINNGIVLAAGEIDYQMQKQIKYAVESNKPGFDASTYQIYPDFNTPQFTLDGITSAMVVKSPTEEKTFVSPLKQDGPFCIEISALFCRPCLELIPHLNKMAEKYNKVPILQVFDQQQDTPA